MMSGKFHLQPVSRQLSCCISCHSNFFFLFEKKKKDNKIDQNKAATALQPECWRFAGLHVPTCPDLMRGQSWS